MAGAAEKRPFGLSAEEVTELAAEFKKTKKFPVPYKAGAYGHTVQALVSLGVNRFFPLAKVHEAFRKAAGEEWYNEWASKEKRNADAGKDAAERFVQNLRVLQRTRDYGLKLLQVGRRVLKRKGAVIDLKRDKDGGLLVALSTDSATPMKPGPAPKDEPKPTRQPRKPKDAKKGKKRPKKAASQPKQPEERPEPPMP